MNSFRAGAGSLVCGSRSSRDGNEVSGFSTLYTAAAEGRREEALEYLREERKMLRHTGGAGRHQIQALPASHSY
ncbi:hypothetical protein E2751_10535 [Salmonella enterica]|nr:hypothetical protein [Salmonella enterica]EDY3377875.1 hypothetical protein [Salmonella enterica]